MIKIAANSKINLALEVMDEKNGYHMVNNIMIPISLYDELEFYENNEIILEDNTIEDNIILKAAKLFINTYQIKSGVLIKLHKKIPMAAGLAGGSSDAAATLKGLNTLFNINASNEELKILAASLGSDVPFFIENKTAICTNRGEIINPLVNNLAPIKLLLLKQNTGLSTKLVYQNYIYDKKSKKEKIDNIILALKNNNINLLNENLFNDLENTSLQLNKELNILFNKLKKNNLNPHISGSGPTIFLFNPSNNEIDKALSLIDSNTFNYICTTI
ncbi:MAG: 4-(cytidine 5'-diphospho)-2-C-methyl-D-erythritol kinase [Anaeroplasma sp.]